MRDKVNIFFQVLENEWDGEWNQLLLFVYVVILGIVSLSQ